MTRIRLHPWDSPALVDPRHVATDGTSQARSVEEITALQLKSVDQVLARAAPEAAADELTAFHMRQPGLPERSTRSCFPDPTDAAKPGSSRHSRAPGLRQLIKIISGTKPQRRSRGQSSRCSAALRCYCKSALSLL
jgi:hypothetical protein